MTKIEYSNLIFNQFPRVWGIISIPENFVIYRTGSKLHESESEYESEYKPRIFSEYNITKLYCNNNKDYEVYECITEELKLVDIRTLRHLFIEFIGYNNTLFNDTELEKITQTKFALGLMSLKEQYEFIKENAGKKKYQGLKLWADKYESFEAFLYDIDKDILDGVSNNDMEKHYLSFGQRISDYYIDSIVAEFLKTIFSDTIDGYIAPHIKSFWHTFNFPQEICLFNPSISLKKSGKVSLDSNIITKPNVDISILLNIKYPLHKNAQQDYINGGGKKVKKKFI